MKHKGFNTYRQIIISILLLLLGIEAQAGIITRNASIAGTGISNNAIVVVQEDLYDYTSIGNALDGFDKRVDNRIFLRYTGANKAFYSTAWSVSVNVKIERYAINGGALPVINTVLNLSYHPNLPYSDIGAYLTTGGYKVVVTVTNVSFSSSLGTILPTDIALENEIEVERYYELKYTNTASINNSATGVNNNAEIFWSYVKGAEEYDLEWVFVSSYLTPQPVNAQAADFSNATRLSTPNNFHKLNLAFDNGKVFYRFRSVGVDVSTTNFGKRTESNWIYGTSPITIGTNFYTTANWNYQAAYAEGGKSNEVASFFDGSQRVRQEVILNNSDDVALISENFYDFEGRKAISTLPAPHNSYANRLGYFSSFSINNAGTSFYSKKDFEDGNCTNNYAMNTLNGASNYYSPANSLLSVTTSKQFIPALPDAFLYPMVRTTYNNESEVAAASGVGADYKIGSGKETLLFNASASQEKLDRLFGNEVGYAQYYKEEVTVDPNGQLAVAFKNLEGKVIATAMRGAAPPNLTSMKDPVNPTDEPYMAAEFTQEDLTSSNQFDATKNGYIVTRDFLVSQAGVAFPYTFNYQITPKTFNDLCVSQTFPCKYLLKITILDKCGNPINAIAPDATYLGTTIPIDPSLFPSGYNKTFVVHFPSVGVYKIQKELILDPQALQTYLAQYTTLAHSAANTCVTPLSTLQNEADAEVDTEECKTCEQIAEDLTDSFFAPTVYAHTNTVWLAKYDEIFQTQCTDEPPKKTCDGLLASMKDDVSPGGQYYDLTFPTGHVFKQGTFTTWTYTGATPLNWIDALAIVNTNFAANFASFCTTNNCPMPTAFTHAWITANWQDCYADFLVNHHPEYCRYSRCVGLIPSDDFDYLLQTLNYTSAQATDVNGNACTGPGCTPILVTTALGPFGASLVSVDPLAVGSTLYTGNIYSELSVCSTCANMVNANLPGGCVPTGSTMWDYATCVPTPLVVGSPNFLNDRWKNFVILYTSFKKYLQTNIGCAPLNDYTQPPDLETDGYSAANSNNVSAPNPPYLAIYENNLQIKDPDLPTLLNGVVTAVSPNVPPSYGSTVNQDECTYIPSFIALSLTQAYFTDLCPAFQGLGNPPFPNVSLDPCFDNSANGIKFYVNSVPGFGSTKIDISARISIPNNYATLSDQTILGLFANGINNYISNPDFTAVVDNTNPLLPKLKILAPNSLSPLLLAPNPQIQLGARRYENCVDFDECQYKAFAPSTKTCIALPPECICVLLAQLNAAYTSANPPLTVSNYQYMADELNAMYFNNVATITAAQTQYWYNNCQSSGYTPYPLDATTNDPIEPLVTDPYYVNVAITCDPPCNQDAEEVADYSAETIFETQVQTSIQNFIKNYTSYCLSNLNELFKVSYNESEYHYTLYYYDQAGNLTRTVPPKAVNRIGSLVLYSGSGGTNIVHQKRLANTNFMYTSHSVVGQISNGSPQTPNTFVTNYQYNSFNQLVTQTTPDGGVANFWYDNIGRLRLSQNAKQVQATCYSGYCNAPIPPGPFNGLYSYTLYDNLNRIIEVGENDAYFSYLTTVSLGGGLFTQVINTAPFYTGVNDPTFPSATGMQVTKTYYNSSIAGNGVVTQFSGGQTQLRNRIASITYEDVEDANDNTYNTASHYSYDVHGSVNTLVQEKSDLAGLNEQYKRIDYTYDLISGKVNTVAYQAGKGDQFYHKYYYDAANRITNALSSKDNAFWNREARYFYYLHGPLARVETGNENVQGTDYVYTMQGWMKLVNGAVVNETVELGLDGNNTGANQYMAAQPDIHDNIARDAYGYSIDYNATDYRSISSGLHTILTANVSANAAFTSVPNLYNGNIRGLSHAYRNPLNETAVPVLSRWFEYDQLNRIKRAKNNLQSTATTNLGTSLVSSGDYEEFFRYDANGNILLADRKGYTGGSFTNSMDVLTYNYFSGNNKLASVSDAGDNAVPASNFGDIKNQNPNNYSYDAIGNLTKDLQSGIGNIEWTVYGKIKRINRFTNSGINTPDLEFEYDPMGNRVVKISKPKVAGVLQTQQFWTYTYYVRDANGNVMATYDRKFNVIGANYNEAFSLSEQHLYGSSRIGITTQVIPKTQRNYSFVSYNTDGSLNGISSSNGIVPVVFNFSKTENTLGYKVYELNNHLGNVISSISDRKLAIDANSDNIIDYYLPDVLGSGDYYAFGAPMPGRTFNSGSYRYGFNGMEKDNEVKGNGNSLDFGARMFDARLGRWLSLDPMQVKYPDLSPYNSVNNNPIFFVDPTGADYIAYLITIKKDGSTAVKVTQYWPSWDGPLEGAAITIQYEGSPGTQTYDFTNFGTLGYNNGQKGGTGNNINQFWTFIREFAKDPEATLRSNKYITQEQMQISDIKAVATAMVIGRLTKQRVLKSAAKRNPCGGCFTELTLITTKKGLKKIKDVVVGDSVLSFSEKTKKLSYKRVVNTFKVIRDTLYKIYIGDDVIEATADHPFYIGNKWIKVRSLKIGQQVQLHDKTKVEIANIKVETGSFEAYNFEVEENRTYYIATQKILVHNSGPCDFEPVVITKKGVNGKTIPGSGKINEAIKKIVNGDLSSQRFNPDNTAKIFSNSEDISANRKWQGSEEFTVDVPDAGDTYRILRNKIGENTDGTPIYRYGYTYEHYYRIENGKKVGAIYEFKPKQTEQ